MWQNLKDYYLYKLEQTSEKTFLKVLILLIKKSGLRFFSPTSLGECWGCMGMGGFGGWEKYFLYVSFVNFNFAFISYDHFPGSKSTITTEISEKVNKFKGLGLGYTASWLFQIHITYVWGDFRFWPIFSRKMGIRHQSKVG